MFGWAAGFVMLLLVAAALGGGLGAVTAGTAFLLFLAFPVLFITALLAVALREPPAPDRQAEADRLARLTLSDRPAGGRIRRQNTRRPSAPARQRRQLEEAGAGR